MSRDGFYTMLVCENGHVLTDRLENSARDDKFCDKCGARAISKCPTCNANIRGDIKDSGVLVLGYTTPAPKYCPECGAPFPWTVSTIEALKEIAELDDELTSEDVETLTESAGETLSETPRTKVAALKIKKVLEKAGKETAKAMRDLLVDVVAETAKRTIWPS